MIPVDLRKKYPLLEQETYLNTPSTGLITEDIGRAGMMFYNEFQMRGSTYAHELLENEIPAIKDLAANFFECPTRNLAFVPSFTLGLQMLVLSWPKDARIMLLEGDYPSITVPLQRQFKHLTQVKAQPHGFYSTEHISEQIVLTKPQFLVLSQVQYHSGQILDLDSINAACLKVGARLIVDGTQHAGAFPVHFDEHPADVYLCSTYKWLTAGFGAGIAMAKEDYLQQFPLVTGGYGSMNWETGKASEGMQALEPNHRNKPAILCLGEALRLHQELGTKNINTHHLGLMDEFLDRCPENIRITGTKKAKDYAAFCCLDDASGDLHQRLTQDRITHTYRFGRVRLGFHFYNNDEDLEHLLKVLS